MEVSEAGRVTYGLPIHWNPIEAVLLDSFGKFHFYQTPEIEEHRVLDSEFHPMALTEARGQLQRELGGNFEIAISGPYVIATHAGTTLRWKRRFGSLLSGYLRYFETRGWTLRKPDFPLVVIVFPDRQQFERYAASEVDRMPSLAVGSYFSRSNRCILYQIPGRSATNWSETEATIVHEAVHQLAYNTGVHERLFENPLWFVEGLATMFEQPALYETGASQGTEALRVHPQKMVQIQPMLENEFQLENRIRSLIETDDFFDSDPRQAYAIAWAMTFYLSEKMPAEFRKLSQLQSGRPYGSYTAAQRRSDFQRAIGIPPRTLVRQMIRFYGDIQQ